MLQPLIIHITQLENQTYLSRPEAIDERRGTHEAP